MLLASALNDTKRKRQYGTVLLNSKINSVPVLRETEFHLSILKIELTFTFGELRQFHFSFRFSQSISW